SGVHCNVQSSSLRLGKGADRGGHKRSGIVPGCTSAKSARSVQSVLRNSSFTRRFHGSSRAWVWTFFHARKAAMHSHKGLIANLTNDKSSGCRHMLTAREKVGPVTFLKADCEASCPAGRQSTSRSNGSRKGGIWIFHSKGFVNHAPGLQTV